jgi:peptidoglycan hydrolase CwlO-like protein
MRPAPPTRWGTVAVAVVLVAALFGPVVPASADARAERAEVQRKRAAVAADIDTLRATDQQVEAALAALQANVAGRSAELRDAERESERAEAAVVAAAARVEAKQAEIGVLDRAVKQAVVAAYVQLPSTTGLLEQLSASNIGEAELKRSLLSARSTDQLDLLDHLERAREDLEVARGEAEQAARAAQDRRATVETQLAEVTRAREQQEAVVAQVQDRLDHRLSEAASLADLDAELSARIEEEQRQLAAQLARQQAADAAARTAREAREAAAATSRRSTPPAAAPRTPAPRAPSAPEAPVTVSIVGSGSIVSVRGIRVHNSIASNVANLLEAADAAGISLAGGGYRDPAAQIAVRRANCGTSNYAVYQMPASSCRPPTARPGSSLHERGLAIDFTHGGRIISSRSSAAFQWLAANASRYGLYNLPSEPWHWSTTGG